jgi:hypothetical protein
MAKKRKSGGSVSALLKQKASLKARLSAIKKAKKDAQRAAKLRREVESLKSQLRNTGRKKR